MQKIQLNRLFKHFIDEMQNRNYLKMSKIFFKNQDTE